MSLTTLLFLSALCAGSAEKQINPEPRALVPAGLPRWHFNESAEGWAAENQCRLSTAGGLLRVESSGNDPYFHRGGLDIPGGRIVVRLRMRASTRGPGQVFWTSTDGPQRDPNRSRPFAILHDGQWHECQTAIDVSGALTDLRIDPGTAPGTVEIDWIEFLRPHPLVIERVDLQAKGARFRVRNEGTADLEISALGKRQQIQPGGTASLLVPASGERPLEALTLSVTAEGLPPVTRTVFVHHADVQTRWIELPLEGFSLQVAADGSLARVRRGDDLVAFFGPLVHAGGQIPALALETSGEQEVRLAGDDVRLSIRAAGREVLVRLDAKEPVEGPVLRALGEVEQGIFAGLEYLGPGERSSSTLDIETPGHVRFAPDLDMVTMPLMAVRTDRVAAAMTWNPMDAQPVYAVPNFLDASSDHRMALRGEAPIEAVVRFGGETIEEQILWGVNRHGLPALPNPPRSPEQQRALCLAALRGPLKTEEGWGHCLGWKSQPFADVASTLWRLTGQAPELDRLVPGGSHVRNEAVYLVTGRAAQWLAYRKAEAKRLIEQQGPDGGFRYGGPLRRGHWEDTASGVCARPAYRLLELAQMTGDEEALAAGLRALEYMKRFGEPRGAQTWEVPLHTPDILASAYAVWACVLGYELTGEEAHLGEARRWALSGVPFVYLWSRHPVMLYSTIPVYGATHWRHSWFGLPVQWCGGVYAYALTRLSPHDDTLDWNHLARGILISAQQQQYPDGEKAGLLPDSFVLKSQQRRPADINPCAILSLQMALAGELDGLAVATGGGHRVVAPFPVKIDGATAVIQGRKGTGYQVVIDGKRIVDVVSQGEDRIPFD